MASSQNLFFQKKLIGSLFAEIFTEILQKNKEVYIHNQIIKMPLTRALAAGKEPLNKVKTKFRKKGRCYCM